MTLERLLREYQHDPECPCDVTTRPGTPSQPAHPAEAVAAALTTGILAVARRP